MEIRRVQINPLLVKKNISEELPSTLEIQDWLVVRLSQMLEVTPDEIDIKISFNRYGLDSYLTVALISELEDWLGCELSPTLMYNYPTIESLARHLGLTSPQPAS